MTRTLIIVWLLLFSKTATAQYVQLSTNILAIPNTTGVVEIELPFARNLAIEAHLGYTFPAAVDWREAILQGWRTGATLKRYFPPAARLNEGLFLGAYLRHSAIEDEGSVGGWLSPSVPYRHRVSKTVLGGLLGFTYVDLGGVYISTAAGMGGNLSLDYACPGTSAPAAGERCGPEYASIRENDLHLYLQCSVGYRVRSSADKARKAAAELRAAELRLERQAEIERVYPSDDPELFRDLSPVKARRLEHKLRYRRARGGG